MLGYPLVLLVWHLPRHAWKRWPFLVVFAPAVYGAVVWLRVTLLAYVAAAIAVVVIATQRDRRFVVPAMVVLALLLLFRFYRAIREAPGANVFARLTDTAAKLRATIENGTWDGGVDAQGKPRPLVSPITLDPKSPPTLYMFHCAAGYISRRVAAVARGRRYNTLLVLDWLHAFALTISVYAVEYWALFRIAPESYTQVSGSGLLQFFVYSLTTFTSSSISPIVAATMTAQVIASTETLSMVFLLVTCVFSLFTARRDSYREDLDLFTRALGEVASAIEGRIFKVYSLSTEAVEAVLLTHNAQVVNLLRRSRGLPSLEPPQVVEGSVAAVLGDVTVTASAAVTPAAPAESKTPPR